MELAMDCAPPAARGARPENIRRPQLRIDFARGCRTVRLFDAELSSLLGIVPTCTCSYRYSTVDMYSTFALACVDRPVVADRRTYLWARPLNRSIVLVTAPSGCAASYFLPSPCSSWAHRHCTRLRWPSAKAIPLGGPHCSDSRLALLLILDRVGSRLSRARMDSTKRF